MKPSYFKECNRRLSNTPPKEAADFFPSTFYADGTNSLYLYKPTIRERISILLFGRVWVTMKTGKDLAPATLIRGKRSVFEKLKKSRDPLVAKASCKRCHGTGLVGTIGTTKEAITCDCLRPKSVVEEQGHKINSGVSA